MSRNANTALVIRNITRCEWGTNAEGYLATMYDRVTIVKTHPKWSSGGQAFVVRNDAGETFHATTHQIQVD